MKRRDALYPGRAKYDYKKKKIKKINNVERRISGREQRTREQTCLTDFLETSGCFLVIFFYLCFFSFFFLRFLRAGRTSRHHLITEIRGRARAFVKAEQRVVTAVHTGRRTRR